MTKQEFEKVTRELMKRVEENLLKKGKEYSRENRLSNFQRASATLRVTPERALLGMMSKHTISILDMIDDLDAGGTWNTETWGEKIGDHITYLYLLWALVKEREKGL